MNIINLDLNKTRKFSFKLVRIKSHQCHTDQLNFSKHFKQAVMIYSINVAVLSILILHYNMLY